MRTLQFISIAILLFACLKKDVAPSQTDDIVIHDWQPDTVISDSITFDPDSNGVDDFRLRFLTVLAGSSPSGGNYYNYFVQAVAVDGGASVTPGVLLDSTLQTWNCMDSGMVVGSTSTWLNDCYLRANVVMAGAVGIWDRNNSYGYIGFRIRNGAAFRYGWLRLHATAFAGGNIVLDAMGFNRATGNSIHAGQTG